MCRRFLFVLMAVVLVVAGLPPQAGQPAAAADPSYFTFDSATGTIYGYSSLGPTDVVIPDEIAGTPVKAIGNEVFWDKGLTSLVIPDSVEEIGTRAFKTNFLTSVTLPQSLVTIGVGAFEDNKLTSVIIPDNVKEVGQLSFLYNELTSVVIPDGVEVIKDSAFAFNKLTAVHLPDSVTTIEKDAFLGNEISTVTMPPNIETIYAGAFKQNRLTSVTIPSSVTTIGNEAFQMNELATVALPDCLVSIGRYAFDTNKLTAVTIPDSVATLEYGAFRKNSLSSLTLPSALEELPQYAFAENLLTTVDLPDSLKSIGAYAFYKNQLNPIALPHQLETIGNGAFSENALTEVALPDSVTAVGDYAFSKNQISHIVFPSAFASFGISAFSENELTDLTIPSWMTTISNSMFASNKLVSLTLPDTIEDIGGSTFRDNMLTAVHFPDSIKTINSRAFMSNQLTSLTLPAGVTTVGLAAFGLNALTTVTILGSSTVISNNAFGSNQAVPTDLHIIAEGGSTAQTYATNNGHSFIDTSLFTMDTATGDIVGYNDLAGPDKLLVPSELSGVAVTGIGSDVFSGSKLTAVTIPGSVKAIGDNAFYNAKLQQLVLSEGIETIGAAAFGNNALDNVLLPFSLKEVRADAFIGNELTTAVVLNKHTIVQSGAFADNSPELTLYGHPGSDAETYAANEQLQFKPLIELSPSGAYAFADAAPRYAPVAPLTVTATKWLPGKLDNLVAALSGTHANAFELSPLAVTQLDDTTTETHFTVEPKAGLPAGTYTATVTLSADFDFQESVHVSFKVKRPVSDDSDNTPVAPGGGVPTAPAEDLSAAPEAAGIDIYVNGAAESIGTSSQQEVNGRTVTTVTIADEQLRQRLHREQPGAVISIPITIGSDIVIGELNGRMVKHMEQQEAVLDIRTEQATYTLQARLIDIDAVSKRFGDELELQDIMLHIEIAVPSLETIQFAEEAASADGLSVVAPPMNFSLKAIYGDRVEEIGKFYAYVERTIVLPEGADPSRITTGVVVEPDGTVRHVPTEIVFTGGNVYARMSSLTNSTYAVVWNPVKFGDTAMHWAKDAVNDMGSRMVIEGTGNGMFDPDRDITRAEFAAIIVRGLGLKQEHGAMLFSDVQTSAWYSGAISTAYAYQLISGFEDGEFRPNSHITREQAMVVMSKAMAITGLKDKLAVRTSEELLHPFADASAVSAWARSGVADGVHAGIVSGRSADALVPQGYVTRAEAAVMIRKLLQQSGLI